MKTTSLPLIASVLALATPAPGASILVDFGVNTETSGTDANGKAWNDVASGRLGTDAPNPDLVGTLFSNLVDSTGTNTGISMTAEAVGPDKLVRIGGLAVDADGGVGTSPAGTIHLEPAANDSLFVNTKGSTDNYYLVVLAGLNPSLTYDFHFLAAAEGGNDNGNANFTVAGASTQSGTIANSVMVVASADDDLSQNFLSILGVVPDDNNEIRISLTSTHNIGADNDNARWNSMEIVVVPEPAAAALLALSIVGFGLRRRRQTYC